MESFKANFLIFVFLVLVGGAAYWAFTSLKAENQELVNSTSSADIAPVVSSEPMEYTPAPIPEEEIDLPEPTPTPTPAPTGLSAELQDLIDDNVLMKKGSRGTRVGVVQRFLNEYGIKVSVDNDYGDSMVTAVKKFQSEQKLSADGQAGPGTYKKMIEWLAAN